MKVENTYSSQLLGGDGAISVLVEQGKCFLELSDLLLCQLIGLEVRIPLEELCLFGVASHRLRLEIKCKKKYSFFSLSLSL